MAELGKRSRDADFAAWCSWRSCGGHVVEYSPVAVSAGTFFACRIRLLKAASARWQAGAEVPGLIKRLQQVAADLRRKQFALDESIASVGDVDGYPKRAEVLAQLQSERSIVAERLRTTVEAMENLRLDLLKLRAGVGSAGELTAAIDAVQRVGEGITYTLQGRSEVARIV